MNKQKPALYLYFFSCLLVLTAIFFDIEELELFAKPIVIPAIYFYYLQHRFKRMNWWFSISLLACFIGEILFLLDSNFDVLWIILCFFISYCILIKFGVDDLVPQKLSVSNIMLGILIVVFLLFVLFSIIDLIEPESTERYIIFLFYGLTLMILTVISLLNFFSEASKAALYFSIMALCIVISDVFYSFYHFIEPIDLFNYINVFFQLASYYCMVSYFLVRIEKPSKFNR
ncbi:lysoplasmalogenase family protein [Flavobacterium sp.]|uniref:lysoplasmalogenase family protein n=1 Tax=Flavobacterium sp. TaxID=239 RepID=UPI003528B060